MKNVPGDGSSLFHSVRMQLEILGIHLQARAMREQLAQYLQEHPYTHDGQGQIQENRNGGVQMHAKRAL